LISKCKLQIGCCKQQTYNQLATNVEPALYYCTLRSSHHRILPLTALALSLNSTSLLASAVLCSRFARLFISSYSTSVDLGFFRERASPWWVLFRLIDCELSRIPCAFTSRCHVARLEFGIWLIVGIFCSCSQDLPLDHHPGSKASRNGNYPPDGSLFRSWESLSYRALLAASAGVPMLGWQGGYPLLISHVSFFFLDNFLERIWQENHARNRIL